MNKCGPAPGAPMTCRLMLILSSALLLSACSSSAWKNSIFDRTPPTVAVDETIGSRQEAARLAEAYRQAYQARADWDAQASQAIEFPIIGLAIATVTEIAYSRPHIGPAKSLAIAGGGLTAINTYLAPRTRMKNALAGAAAMACVRDAAYGVQTWDDHSDNKQHANTVLRSYGLKDAAIGAPEVVAIKQTISELVDDELRQLSSAIGAINQVGP